MNPKLTWSRAAQIWWSFAWRSTVIFGISSILFGIVLALFGADKTSLPTLLGGVISLAINVLAWIWAMRQALEKDYGDFSVTLTPPYAQSHLEELEAAATPEL